MNQIFILSVVGFILFILYKLVGNQMYMIFAVLAILYLFWGKDKVKLKSSRSSSFINSDPQMMRIIERLDKYVKPVDIFVYQTTRENIDKFIEIYIQHFTKGLDSLDFQVFADTRRVILNDLMKLVVSSNIDKQIEDIVKELSDCTWKYIHVIATKHDISVNQPLAHNAFIEQDLF